MSSQIQLNLPGARLLREAFRICRKNGVSAHNAVVSKSLLSDLNMSISSGSPEFFLSNTEAVRSVAKVTLDNSARMVSGIWRAYFDEMHSLFRECERCDDILGDDSPLYDHLIHIGSRMNHAARDRAVDFEDVRIAIGELQAKSDAWRSRRLPNVMTAYRLHHFLKRIYMPTVRRLMKDVDCMRPDAVRGFIGFYKDNLDIISAFACMDGERVTDFLELAESFNCAFGMERLYRSLEHVHFNIFKSDREQTAVALMGHEVSSRELMTWVLGHRLSGFNLVRMHGDLAVSQIGSAEENLMRARRAKDLGMAQAIVTYLDEEVSIEEGDPIAEHARLILLKEATQVSRGLYGDDLDPVRLAERERKVSAQIDALEEALRSRAKRLSAAKVF